MSLPGHAFPPDGRLVSDEGATYQLEGELGRGSMGVVYRAFDERAGRRVAIKVGSPSAESARLERFRREGEIAASLEHSGIVRVHSAGSIGRRPFLCFELVEESQTLDERLASLELPERLRLVAEVADALGYAHSQGVVHRDVKPENVLVDSRGAARLTDFGVALGRDQDRLTGTGTTVGTPYYASPEQLRDGHRVGPRADVWSLGVILYEALTGVLPFQGESLLSLVAQISSGTFEVPRRLSPSVSPRLEGVCLRALRVDPAERYEDGAAFAADLRRAGRGEATEAERAQSRRFPWRLALSLGLVLGGGLGVWLALRSPSTKDEGGRPTLSPRVAVESWPEGASEALARGEPRRALEILAEAPAEEPRANTLRARAWLDLGQGPEAAKLIAKLPSGRAREVLRLEAGMEGASQEEGWITRAQPIFPPGQRPPPAKRDLELLRWRLLEISSRPGSLGTLERAYRRARRGSPQAEAFRKIVDMHRVLAGFSWKPNAVWALAEESQRDPRLVEAIRFMAQVRSAALVGSERRALALGVQRWLVVRLRLALSRLHEGNWNRLAEAGANLLDSPEALEIRLLVMAGRVNGMDDIVLQPLGEEGQALLARASERVDLSQRVRRLLLAAKLARGVGLETPAISRGALVEEVLRLLPPGRLEEQRGVARTQALEAVKEACLIEALRCTEEAWLAESRAEREGALRHARSGLAAVREHFAPGWIEGDWRYRVAELRVAVLSGEVGAFDRARIGPWTDSRRHNLREAFVIETHLLAGNLDAARQASAVADDSAYSWHGLLGNQRVFLEDPPRGPVQPTPNSSSQPFPWRREEETRRLLEAGWRPGQPLLRALGRE